MIAVSLFKGKKVALFGLGGSGLATALALQAGGAAVIVWDDNAAAVEKARAQGLEARDLRAADWREISALVLSPGVPLTHPQPHWSVALARASGVEIIGDIELFVRMRNAYLAEHNLQSKDCPFIAITGTNGKSTTTALVSHLLREAGCDVQTGGNIGTAILSLEPPARGRFFVIECSSYQIDLTPSLNPTVGILLNITPDHIDRHGSFKNYAALKERVVANADTAVISVDDETCRAVFARVDKALPVSVLKKLPAGAYAQKEELFYQGRPVASLAGIASLRGAHNAQNALAALACCRALDVRFADVGKALQSFTGLPHRMEEVGRKGHVVFVNDSKATNAEAAAPALAAFEAIYWIAGGVEKEGGIESLRRFFPKIRKAYLIGAAAADFARTIGGAIPVVMVETLENAVKQAAKDALEDNTKDALEDGTRRDAVAGKARETVVLLSPACASFDQFANYGARGDAFRQLVAALDDY
ncbi:MAG: UDP-N-acetylmuramoylalanine--D-glutamate ligase [Candidatus Tokpelaia hoelldobleri]|uniref:UDP-N-acetylmuramoylalanine--D-glutamate ligase n=1 Tax=Candidatus Tokpelaia hoelldobleri TaxID=1902579 RepID=A0A1U9JVY0_9HYPH|nr:MAG: UDP-N-acetylmuramoylalanine--D-glutamate ligase [Candidatus Tokpelaia hoelldoblerii]